MILDSLNTHEIHRLSLLIGAFVAAKYREEYGIIPGGIVIPGFLIILFLISPVWCLTTIVLSLLAYFAYVRFLARSDYKRRTPMYMLAILTLPIASLIALLYVHLGWLPPALDSLTGTLIPSLIAFTCLRQELSKTFKGMAIATGITALIIGAIYLIGTYALKIDFNYLSDYYVGLERLEFKYPLIQFYVALIVGYILYRFHDIRSGGYLIAPVAAILLLQPISAITFLFGCFMVYTATQLFCEITLITGLNRYALVLSLSTIFVWGVELLMIQIDPTILPFQGSSFFVIIAILSYVNDTILYIHKNIIFYITLTILISMTTILLINIFSFLLV